MYGQSVPIRSNSEYDPDSHRFFVIRELIKQRRTLLGLR